VSKLDPDRATSVEDCELCRPTPETAKALQHHFGSPSACKDFFIHSLACIISLWNHIFRFILLASVNPILLTLHPLNHYLLSSRAPKKNDEVLGDYLILLMRKLSNPHYALPPIRSQRKLSHNSITKTYKEINKLFQYNHQGLNIPLVLTTTPNGSGARSSHLH